VKEALQAYVKRVRDLFDHVKGNEQATKSSIVGPLFTSLGYDMADPRECLPEFKADFGPGRSSKPIDWAFFINGKPAFFVEVKEAGKRLAGYDEQLGDYFAKAPEVKLGILTNGVQWKFFTDAVNPNVMDKEPFAVWNVLNDEHPPYDVLRVIEKAQYNHELIRTYATRRHQQNLLLNELERLLEPSNEFVRLAVQNIETRNLTAGVVESWKAIVANAIEEWARQRTLNVVLSRPASSDSPIEENSRIETTPEELEAFDLVKAALGSSRPVGSEDTVYYYKVHLPNQPFWAVCRLVLNKKNKHLWVPLPIAQAEPLVNDAALEEINKNWTRVKISGIHEIKELSKLLQLAYDTQKEARGKEPKGEDE
jgi:hypothetical protein